MLENEHKIKMIIILPLLFISSVVCLNVSKGALLDISKLLKDFQVRNITISYQNTIMRFVRSVTTGELDQTMEVLLFS